MVDESGLHCNSNRFISKEYFHVFRSHLYFLFYKLSEALPIFPVVGDLFLMDFKMLFTC